MNLRFILKFLIITISIAGAVKLIYTGSQIEELELNQISASNQNINSDNMNAIELEQPIIPDTAAPSQSETAAISVYSKTDFANQNLEDSELRRRISASHRDDSAQIIIQLPVNSNQNSGAEKAKNVLHLQTRQQVDSIKQQPNAFQPQDKINLKDPRQISQLINPSIDEPDTANMIFIPAGNFEFGNPPKIVFVDDFYIDKYEVSNEEFKRIFVNYKFRQGDETKPVVQITITEALEYARRTGKDLPTVYEWEKAAGWNNSLKKKYKYPWGDEYKTGYALNIENANYQLSPVHTPKTSDISPFGAHFMAGNVAEWTKSKTSDIDLTSAADAKHKNDYICKGGSIFDGPENCAIDYNYFTNGAAQTGIGFRCVKRVGAKKQ